MEQLHFPVFRHGDKLFCQPYDNNQIDGTECSGIVDVLFLALQNELKRPVGDKKYTDMRRRICSLMTEHKDKFSMISTSETKGLCIALVVVDGQASGALPQHQGSNPRIDEINDKIADLMRVSDCWSNQESHLVSLFSIDDFVHTYITVYWYWDTKHTISSFDAYVISIYENQITFGTNDFIIRCDKTELIWTSVHKTRDCDKVSQSYPEEFPDRVTEYNEQQSKIIADTCLSSCFQKERFAKFFNELSFKTEDTERILQVIEIKSESKFISFARVLQFSCGFPFLSLRWYNDMKDTEAMRCYLQNQDLSPTQIGVPGQGKHKPNESKSFNRYNQLMHMCTNFEKTLGDISAFQMTGGFTCMFLCATEALYVDGMLDDLDHKSEEELVVHMIHIAMHIFANMSWARFRRKDSDCNDFQPLKALRITLLGVKFEDHWTKKDFPDVVQVSDDNTLFYDSPAIEDAHRIDESEKRWPEYVGLLHQTDSDKDIGRKRKAGSQDDGVQLSQNEKEVAPVKDWKKKYNDMERQKREADAQIIDLQKDLVIKSEKIKELEKQNRISKENYDTFVQKHLKVQECNAATSKQYAQFMQAELDVFAEYVKNATNK